eukprot:TRINITY_DN60467_c0_g1_i1.p1 TRINITY_DN60467_c0_g1~~TRINITY_DN60467_c0_g1_i1.p1  ORF type:complete len:183 (-),score=53.62 TRINITY_DN60467_c0_g1_i1:115-663(-)
MGNSGGKDKISKEDMQFLQDKTQLDKDSIQEWYEGFLRDCPSGELSQTKFIAMYSKIFPSGNADNFSQNIFRTFDTNNSGTIDFREFMLALHVTSKGSPEEKLAWAFRMYDVDGNGSIEFNEMKRVVGAVYEMLGTEGGHAGKAQELFDKMDQNSDGLVSQEEFVEVCSRDQDLLNILQGKS